MWSTPEARLAATKNCALSGESLIVEAVRSMAGSLPMGSGGPPLVLGPGCHRVNVPRCLVMPIARIARVGRGALES